MCIWGTACSFGSEYQCTDLSGCPPSPFGYGGRSGMRDAGSGMSSCASSAMADDAGSGFEHSTKDKKYYDQRFVNS